MKMLPRPKRCSGGQTLSSGSGQMSPPTRLWGGDHRFYKKQFFLWSLPKTLIDNKTSNNSLSTMSQLYQLRYVYPLVFRYNYEHFEKKSIVESLKCIWVYSDSHGNCCKVCRLYKKWAIESLEKKWLPEYIDFHSFVYNLKKRNLRYEYIAHLPTGYSLYLRQLPRATTTSTTKTKADLLIVQHKVEKTSHNKFYNQTNKYYFTKASTTTTTKITATTASGSMGYFY